MEILSQNTKEKQTTKKHSTINNPMPHQTIPYPFSGLSSISRRADPPSEECGWSFPEKTLSKYLSYSKKNQLLIETLSKNLSGAPDPWALCITFR